MNQYELPHVTELERNAFRKVTSLKLDADQADRAIKPAVVFREERSILAIHWHPEMVPLDLVECRLMALYPNATESLVIPTQHNDLMTYGAFAGAEIDCRASAFNRKIQLLIHFAKEKLERADTLRSMLDHTFRYRQKQFFELVDTILNPAFEDRREEAAEKTGTETDLVDLAGVLTGKLKLLLKENEPNVPTQAIKNKLLVDFCRLLVGQYDRHILDRIVIFLSSVKEIVKRNFSLEYFYEAQEIIEEVRALGGGIIVPHPEQFWPVLLADYDVDGYEVWNPQSREFTEFLIQVVNRKNRERGRSDRKLLVVMGDDTHLSEKILDPGFQNPAKAEREIGYQPVWHEPAIQKVLEAGNFEKKTVINEYKNRL